MLNGNIHDSQTNKIASLTLSFANSASESEKQKQ